MNYHSLLLDMKPYLVFPWQNKGANSVWHSHPKLQPPSDYDFFHEYKFIYELTMSVQSLQYELMKKYLDMINYESIKAPDAIYFPEKSFYNSAELTNMATAVLLQLFPQTFVLMTDMIRHCTFNGPDIVDYNQHYNKQVFKTRYEANTICPILYQHVLFVTNKSNMDFGKCQFLGISMVSRQNITNDLYKDSGIDAISCGVVVAMSKNFRDSGFEIHD
jgi:hypothetical protein